MQFVEERWYLFAVLSGALLMLTFYPFHIWPLCFVAYAPLYIVAASKAGKREVFLAGCIAGGMLAFEVSFLMVAQFHWLPAAHLFVSAIQYGGVAAAVLLYGGLFGLWAFSSRILRGRSLLLSSLSAAAVYIVLEGIAQYPVGGYYIATLSYAAAPFPAVMSFAAAGGAFFVSYIIIWINIFLAEIYSTRTAPQFKKILRDAGIVFAALALIYAGNQWYLRTHESDPQKFSVGVIQLASLSERAFAAPAPEGGLVFPEFDQYLADIGSPPPDLIVYPDSIVSRVIEAGDKNISQWISARVPAGSTLMTWDNVDKGAAVVTGFRFWQEKGLIGEKTKEALVPFMDYAPGWAQRIGFYSMPFDVTAHKSGPTAVAPARVGGLICSEIHRAWRAREEAQNSSLLIAAGSEAMFEDDVGSGFSLQAAQYRAAENNVPVVRTTIIGPSAIISADGTIEAQMKLGEGGILRGEVVLRSLHGTLYTRWGDAPLYLFIAVILFLAGRARFLERRGSK